MRDGVFGKRIVTALKAAMKCKWDGNNGLTNSDKMLSALAISWYALESGLLKFTAKTGC